MFGMGYFNQSSRFQVGAGKGLFFSTASRSALGPIQLHFQWVSGALTPEIKRPGREDDHSSSSSAEDNAWSYTSPVRLHGMVLS